jgi:4-hydroxy-tetrahydrodipicolinate reductase
MGAEVCRAVDGDPDLELVAAVDPRKEGLPLGEVTGQRGAAGDLVVGASLDELVRSRAEVAVDFTVAEVAVATMRWCAQHSVHAVVGTSGVPREELSEIGTLFSSSRANCLIVSNFAIGAVLMMRFAEMAAPYMDSAEIVELHHDGKLDAPSGTAITSAERMARARADRGLGDWPPDRTVSETLSGSRGAEGPGAVRLHSVRLKGLVAHQEIVFGAPGQTLSIRHDTHDRTSFMPGVLLAVKGVSRLDGLTEGLDELLGLSAARS